MQLAYPAGIRKDIWKHSLNCTATSLNRSPPGGKTAVRTRSRFSCRAFRTASRVSGSSMRYWSPLAMARLGLQFLVRSEGRVLTGQLNPPAIAQFEEPLHPALSLRTMNFLSREATHSDGKPHSPDPLINRRDLVRAALFASAASALGPAFSFAQAVSSGLTPAAQGEDGSTFLRNSNWKALFLNDQQNETLSALSDVIIPATGTPGAKEALVNRYLDLLLSVQPTEFQRQFVDALAFIDSESQVQFGKDFRLLAPDDQIW